MISISAHALASQSLARLHTFALTDASSTALKEAVRRVDDAERDLHAQLSDAQAGFVEVMRRMLAKPGVVEGNVSALNWDGLEGRVARLETMGPIRSMGTAQPHNGVPETIHLPPPPPPNASMPPDPPPETVRATPPQTGGDVEMPLAGVESTDVGTTRERRSRARQLLAEVLSRMEAVEAMKQGFEDRFDEFENHLFLGQGEAIDQIRTWDELERQRDPTRRLRGERRPSEPTEVKEVKMIQEEEMEAMQDEVAEMRKERAETKKESAEMKDEVAETKKEMAEMKSEVAETKKEMVEMKKEMASLRAERSLPTESTESRNKSAESALASASGMKEEIQALRDQTVALRAEQERYQREMIEAVKRSVEKKPDTAVPTTNGHLAAPPEGEKGLGGVSPRPATNGINGE